MGQNFYMNGIHRSMPDLTNPNEIDSKFKQVPSRFMQVFGSSIDNESENTQKEPLKHQKSRFQQLDMNRADSYDSGAIKAGEMNLNIYSITNSQNDGEEMINTEQSDYGGSQLISQVYKAPNFGLPPIPVNRFLK